VLQGTRQLREHPVDTYVKIQSLHLVAKIHNKHVRDRQKFINNMIKRHNNKINKKFIFKN
jgi:hypothetical protein